MNPTIISPPPNKDTPKQQTTHYIPVHRSLTNTLDCCPTAQKMADTTAEELLAPRFAALGLGEKVLKEATRNKKVTSAWNEVLEEAGIDGSKSITDPKVGVALTSLVTATAKGDGVLGGKRAYIVKAILDGKI